MLAKTKSTSLLDRERRNHLNRRLKIFGVLFLFTVTLIGVYYLVFFSDLVKVESVNIIGNESVSEEDIISIVNEKILENYDKYSPNNLKITYKRSTVYRPSFGQRWLISLHAQHGELEEATGMKVTSPEDSYTIRYGSK